MTKFIATLKNGKQIVKTTEDGITSRIEFYNWICVNRLGEVEKIECRPL